MRFIHTADVHLGCLRGVKTIPFEAKLRRYEATLREVFETARRKKVGYVVIAGDVFDHKNVIPKVRDVLVRVLVAYDDLTVLMINGNHDLLEDGYTSLHFLSILQSKNRLPNLYLAECEPRIVPFDDAVFMLVPFTGDDEGYAKLIKRLVKQAKTQAECIDKGFEEYTLPIIVVGHEMVRGSSNDAGRRFSHGVTLPKLKAVTYYAMGDIHKRQTLGGLPNAWYPGPPAQKDFGERPDKGVLLVDTDRPKRPKHVAIQHPAIAPLIQVEADDVDDAREALEDVSERAWVNLRAPGDVRAALNPEDSGALVVKASPSPRQQREAAEESVQRIRIRVRDPFRALPEFLTERLSFSQEDADDATNLARNL